MRTRLLKLIAWSAPAVALVAVVLAFVAVPSVGAAPLRQDATPVPNAEDCTGCHEGLRGYWEQSAHSQALTDPKFQEAWTQQGSPKECLACHTTGYDPATGDYKEGGVGCLSCHSPVPSNHPDSYMPTDVSSRLCGDCHVDTFNEWEVSEHGKQGMTCNQCHNPHTSELKVGHSQELCNSCHNTEGHYFSFTGHAAEGLLCTDCHLRVSDSPGAGTMGHGQREHSFKIDLKTCNDCHLEDMHAAVDETAAAAAATTGQETESPVACYPVESTEMPAANFVPARQEVTPAVDTLPSGPSPLVYILPAGFGLVFGTVIAPWIDRLSKRRNHREEGDK